MGTVRLRGIEADKPEIGCSPVNLNRVGVNDTDALGRDRRGLGETARANQRSGNSTTAATLFVT